MIATVQSLSVHVQCTAIRDPHNFIVIINVELFCRISLTVLKFCCSDLNGDNSSDASVNTRNPVSCKQLSKAMAMQQKKSKGKLLSVSKLF